MTDTQSPQFDAPPLVEVVFGLQFEPLRDLKAVHIGLLWDAFRHEFPETDEKAPLRPTFDVLPEGRELQFKLTNVPSLPRVWFISDDEGEILQVQRDRFLFNWRRTSRAQAYPSFAHLFTRFCNCRDRFLDALAELGIDSLNTAQIEVTYVNHVRTNEQMGIGDILPDLSWGGTERHLPEPDQLQWHASFSLEHLPARLHTDVKPIRVDDVSLTQFELTVRGLAREQDGHDGAARWFQQADQEIVSAFLDLTSTRAQRELWGRKQ